MATDTDARDPRDMTDEEEERARRAELLSGAYRRPRTTSLPGPLPAAPDVTGRYAGATEFPRIEPRATADATEPPAMAGPTGTMPRIKTPRITKPEAPAGSEQATRDELEELRYKREHPMGTLGTPSGYSGVGGKILHGLARTGETALDFFRPGRTQEIPGTPEEMTLRDYMLHQRLQAQEKGASEAALRAAQAKEAGQRGEHEEEEAEKLRRMAGTWQPAPGPPEEVLRTNEAGDRERLFRNEAGQQKWGPETGIAPEAMPTTGAQPTALPAEGTLPRAVAPPQPVAAPTPTPGQKPKYTYGVTPKASAEEQQRDMVASIAAMPENQRTPEQQNYLDKNRARYEKDIPITQQQADRENAKIKQDFAGVPGGRPESYYVKAGDSLYDVKQAHANVGRDVTALGAAANRNMRQADKYYIYEGELVRGNKVPLDADATPVKDPEKMRQKMTAVNSFLKQLDRYQGSFDASGGKLTRDDLAALETLTDANVAHGFAEDLLGVVSDFVAGKPLQGYSQKVMRGVMTEEQYNRMSQPAKDLLVKYYNTILNNFANIRERLNALGRNESMIQAEIHTIPLPYIDSRTATTMLNDKRADVADNAWWLTPEQKAEFAPKRTATPTTGEGRTNAPPPGARIRRIKPDGTVE